MKWQAALTCAFTLCSGQLLAADGGFLSTPLSQLSDVKVTSVSKHEEKASEVAAALHVITQEDIQKLGATSVPEALRIVPGLNVARAGSHQWAISSRGFNDQFANKLLVLIDGRSVYNPIFSGVYWELQQMVMEDIERIEVIRGPGAAVWGANAVNGVINVITKSAKDTQGTLLSTTVGNEVQFIGSARYGGTIDDDTYYRGYAQQQNFDGAEYDGVSNQGDSWSHQQTGFRVDSDLTESSSLTVQGDLYKNTADTFFNLPSVDAPFSNQVDDEINNLGGNILARYSFDASEDSKYRIQGYIDFIDRHYVLFDEERTIFDVEVQHDYTGFSRHHLTWGAGYRNITDKFEGTDFLSYQPIEDSEQIFSAFVQDRISLLPEELFLTLGSKFEHNDHTHFEIQPSARLAWLMDDRNTLWGSVSRAVRTPNRTANDISFAVGAIPLPNGDVGIGRLVGRDGQNSENLMAFEVGYRSVVTDNFSVDIATFYNVYDDLGSNVFGTPFVENSSLGSNPFLAIPVFPGNENDGKLYGIEINTQWNPLEDWQLTANYSLLKTDLEGGSSLVTTAGSAPQQQVNMQSHYNFTENISMTNTAYWVDEISPATNVSVDNYLRLDTRVGWEPIPGLELSLVGQNLLDQQHPEFSGFIYNNNAEIGRSFFGKAVWQF